MKSSGTDHNWNPGDGDSANPLMRYRYLLLAVIGTVLYVGCIGLRDLWYPDEPDVAEVAQAMFLSGDWIAPRRMGVIWVDYPPLLYWAGSIAAHVFGGMTEFTLRLPSALAAIGLALLTCAVGSRWFGPSAGLWSGFLLLVFPQFALQAMGYRPDMLFSLFIGAGFFVYALGAQDNPRWHLRATGFALLGLAMLTKGPLGLLLPGLVLTLWHTWRRQWWSILALAPLSLIPLTIYLAWFIACANQMGADNILTELWLQNFARFGSGFRGHERPFFYYMLIIWYDMAPWTLLLPLALWWLHRSGAWRDRNQQLLLCWFGAFFVFLSIAATKRQMYLLPAYPAAALLIGQWVSATIRGVTESARDQRLARLFVVLIAVVVLTAGASYVIAGLSAGFIVPHLDLAPLYQSMALELRAPGLVIGLLALGGGVFILRAWRRSDLAQGFYRVALTLVALYLLAFAWFMPSFDPVKSYRPAGRWIRERIGSETHFGLAFPRRGRSKMGGFGFYSGRLVELLDSEDAIEQFLREHPKSVVLVAERAVKKLYGKDRTDWQAAIVKELRGGRYEYFVLQKKDKDSTQGLNASETKGLH